MTQRISINRVADLIEEVQATMISLERTTGRSALENMRNPLLLAAVIRALTSPPPARVSAPEEVKEEKTPIRPVPAEPRITIRPARDEEAQGQVARRIIITPRQS